LVDRIWLESEPEPGGPYAARPIGNDGCSAHAIHAADKDILITLPAADEVIADIIDGMNALPAHIAG